MINERRRDFLTGAAILLFTSATVRAATITGQLPWMPNAGNPPTPFKSSLAERLISVWRRSAYLNDPAQS
jgi:hypothetical protein